MSFIIPISTLVLEKLASGRTRQWLANKTLGTTGTALIENYFDEGGFVPPHSHAVEELLVCLEGHGQVTVNGEPYDFPAGSVAVIPPMAVHKVQNIGKEKMRMLGFFPEAAPESMWVKNDEALPLKPEA